MFNTLNSRKFTKKILLVLFFICFFSLSKIAFAATLNFSPSYGSYNVGDTIKVRITLTSSDKSANAVSASVSFSKELLTLASISKSNSLINLWAQEPSLSNANGNASLEGVILNGYTGSAGTIVTLSFKAKAIGSANVIFSSSAVLANDGQGTNILTNSGEANFSIKEKEVIEKPVSKPSDSSNDKIVPSLQIQELKKENVVNATSKFLITSVGKKANSSYKIDIDGLEYPWLNSSSGIFATPPLLSGTHKITVTIDTINNEKLSSSASFSVLGISIPTFTEYSENIKEKGYIVVKGLADPNTDVVINLSGSLYSGIQYFSKESTIKSDEKGLFTYVSEKAIAGDYELGAYSFSKEGGKSAPSVLIKIKVSSLPSSFWTKMMEAFSLIIPLLALLLLLIFLVVWGWYKVLYYRENVRRRLAHTRALVIKSFSILEDDIDEQMKILKKMKAIHSLSEEEKAFANQFKKDIQSSEQVIISDIKD